MHVLSDARARHDGTRRSPWNEIECGDYYTRQMGGFSLFEIAAGSHWSAPTQTLTFGPRIGPTSFQGFFITNTGWGQYLQKTDAGFANGAATILPAWGTVAFTTLRILATANTASVTLDGKVR
jgi:non-lysosomal glucosylceramidase